MANNPSEDTYQKPQVLVYQSLAVFVFHPLARNWRKLPKNEKFLGISRVARFLCLVGNLYV